MTLTITHTRMDSNVTAHTAQLTRAGTWRVSWMPASRFSQSQAITAMKLAEKIATREEDRGGTFDLICSLAEDLDMTGSEAIRRVTS